MRSDATFALGCEQRIFAVSGILRAERPGRGGGEAGGGGRGGRS